MPQAEQGAQTVETQGTEGAQQAAGQQAVETPEEQFDYIEPVLDEQQYEPDPQEAARERVATVEQQLQTVTSELERWRQWGPQAKAYAEALERRLAERGAGNGDDEDGSSPAPRQSSASPEYEARFAALEQQNRHLMDQLDRMGKSLTHRDYRADVRASIAALEADPNYGKGFVSERDVAQAHQNNPRLSTDQAAKVAAQQKSKWLRDQGYVRRQRREAPPMPGPGTFIPPPSFEDKPVTSEKDVRDQVAAYVGHFFPDMPE